MLMSDVKLFGTCFISLMLSDVPYGTILAARTYIKYMWTLVFDPFWQEEPAPSLNEDIIYGRLQHLARFAVLTYAGPGYWGSRLDRHIHQRFCFIRPTLPHAPLHMM